MTSPEAEFTRELEVFGTEADSGIQFFYSWLTVHSVAGDDKRIYQFLNQSRLFWNTVLGALQTASLIALGRVFDQDPSTHNIDRLLRIAQTNLTIFSKEALAERKRRATPNADEWLTVYLRKVYVPTAADFRRLRRHAAARRRVYESNYRPLRHKFFAHKEVSGPAHIKALFAKTKIRELQQLLVFLSRLHDALWELLYNGRKPNLRPARYSVKGIREHPSPTHRRRDVQERLIHETEQFLKSLVGDRPIHVARGSPL
jgi:hypothetical protein